MAITWAFRCAFWGFASASLTTYVAAVYLMSEASWVCRATAGMFVICGALSTVIAFHISTLRCSETHTLKTLLVEYFIYQLTDLSAPLVMSKMTKIWKEPRKEQEKFLRMLISRDVNTEYGRRYLRGIGSLQNFQDKHPLTKYEHYQDYFQRLADGEKNVCVAGKVERFGISSGTTGKGKLIPIVRTLNGTLAATANLRHFLKPSPVQRVSMLYCKPARKFTKSGLAIAPLAFIPEGGFEATVIGSIMSVPFQAFQISTDLEATYVDLLFALTDRNISMFIAPFASQVYRAFKMLEDEQAQFLEDLAEGRVNPRLNIDEGIRRSLNAALKVNPARADELRRDFARGFAGIVGRIWPHLKCVLTIDISGYMKKLDAWYTKGTKLISSAYGCTESMIMGIKLSTDGTKEYVLLPSDALFEFIPEDLSGEENPETLFIDEVEIGKRYEIVITTVSGFYRYRMGDVVKVVNFHENCPVIQVLYRTGELLNLRSEKIDKLVVSTAIEECLLSWPGATLVEWTCAESPLMHEDHEGVEFDMFYLLFVELASAKDLRLSTEQKSLLDKSLRKQHEVYDHYRQIGTICEARVFVVRPGSFKKMQDFIIATSTASYNQFKMPKKLRTKATLEMLMQSVVDL